MATAGQKRTRSERVAALELPPSQWERAWVGLRRRDVLGRAALAFLAALAICVIIRAWDPPFSWRSGYVPARNITSRVNFGQESQRATENARQAERSKVPYIFTQDPRPLVDLRASLRYAVVQLATAPTLAEAPADVWQQFQLPRAEGQPAPTPEQDEARFQEFRKVISGKENLDRFDRAIAAAFDPYEQHGLLEKLPTEDEKGNEQFINVLPVHGTEPLNRVQVSDALIGDGGALRQRLQEELRSKGVADRVFAWVFPRLTPTLKYDKTATDLAKDEAANAVATVSDPYKAGSPLVPAGEAIGPGHLRLLHSEYEAFLAQRPLAQRLVRGGAVLAVIFVLFILCGIQMRIRQRGPLARLTHLSVLLLMAVATVGLACWASRDSWRAELVPLMLFGMTLAIVYRHELAVLLSGVLAWIITLAIGNAAPGLLLLFGTTVAACLNLGRIRSRSKLIYVGLFAGGVAALLDIAMNLIDNQPLGLPLMEDAARNGLWAVAAGFVMTGMLPFIERTFGVLTDLSLLELGDISHPLLQELVRRAPSTYNHSVTVGSIGEAAADSIGARGLLCRVGAYFHDIGKMLKPGYFIENQGSEASRHEALVPAMSTLVIIAHIKDGADLARQHRLPQPIIDMIMQHHGTTLVEYFFDRAHEKADSNGGEVDENTFRYPGPKPQTKEAAVLMLADAVESASRTLIDPAPARIESLVRDIAQRRLHNGQFDESGLTLRELRAIERSMIMSLTAIYHGRLKYPEQREPREQRTA
jgi:cyclic-di-AMP phosphodiesterase PgpH